MLEFEHNLTKTMKANRSKKATSAIQEGSLKFLEIVSKTIAFVICLHLLIASVMLVINAFEALFHQNFDVAIQDSLFVLILLEMFYVVRSFMRYGSLNVSLIVNVGIIASIKEMIFQLDNLNMQMAIAFGVIFVTLGLTYFMEQYYYRKMVKEVEGGPFLT